jgi:hypothetical protein
MAAFIAAVTVSTATPTDGDGHIARRHTVADRCVTELEGDPFRAIVDQNVSASLIFRHDLHAAGCCSSGRSRGSPGADCDHARTEITGASPAEPG